MSLKAYDGMMTRKGFGYLQESLKTHLPELRKASEDAIAEAIAELYVKYTDDPAYKTPKSLLVFETKDKRCEKELEEIENSGNLLSLFYQFAKVLSRSEFVNSFTVHLTMNIEMREDRLLIYPGIYVNSHKVILLKFLEDWYAQNQTDQPEDVPEDEWKLRCKDWWEFNETGGMKIQVRLFDPHHYADNIMNDFRGEKLIQAILEKIPSDEIRMKRIWKDQFLSILMDEAKEANPDAKNMNIYWKASDTFRSEEGMKRYEEFKKANPIELVKIDEDYISNMEHHEKTT